MTVSVEDLFNRMMNAGVSAFGTAWKEVETFAETEFRSLAAAGVDIARNLALHEAGQGGYNLATAKILFRMHRRAVESALVALTSLILIAVTEAINAVLNVVAQAFSELADIIL